MYKLTKLIYSKTRTYKRGCIKCVPWYTHAHLSLQNYNLSHYSILHLNTYMCILSFPLIDQNGEQYNNTHIHSGGTQNLNEPTQLYDSCRI